jgi:hypothetical protein
MKRPSELFRNIDVYRIFPLLFWHKCCKCKQEFVRQLGWRTLVGPYINGMGQWIYICNDCISTRTEAKQYIASGEYKGVRPPPPGFIKYKPQK